jgi:tetratricopeptide (TPR) repeat protein
MNHSYSFFTLFTLFLLLYFGTVQAGSLFAAKQAFQQGYYEKAFLQWQAVVDTTPNPAHRLEALLGIARIHRRLGVYNQADSILQTALPVAQQAGNITYHALLLNEFSKLYLSKGEKSYPAALESGKQAVNIARKANDLLVLIEVLNHWGNLLTVEYDYDGAMKSFSEALTHVDNYKNQLSIRSQLAKKPDKVNQEIETLRSKVLINQAQTIFLKEAELTQFPFGKPTFIASITALQSALQSIEHEWTDSYKQVFGLIALSQLAQKIQAQLPKPATQLTQIAYKTLPVLVALFHF